MALNSNTSQEVLTTVKNDGKDIDVIVQRDAKAFATSLDDVLATEIKTALGTTMTIGELVDVEEGTTLNSLSRSKVNISQQYLVRLSVTIFQKPLLLLIKIDKLDLQKV